MSNETVSSLRPDTASISVYQVGDAVVHERRLVTLSKGLNQVLVQGLPANFSEDSFQVCKVDGPAELKLGADSFSPAELGVDTLLRKSIGSRITVQDDSGDTSCSCSGVLRYVFGDKVVLETDDGVQVVQLGSKFKLTCLPAGLRETPTLSVEAHATVGGAYTLHSLYETAGLSWSAMYSLFYDAAAGKFKSLQCRVKLSNTTGAHFDNARFHLLTGTNSSRGRVQAQRGAYETTKFALSAGAAPGAQVSVESLGEQKVYTLPDPLSISHGQTKRPQLIVMREIPVRSEYFVEAAGYRADTDKHPVKVRLLVENTSENNLGVDLPAGEAAVFQADQFGQEQKTEHSLSIEQLAVGEELRLELNTPCAEIKAARQLLSLKEDPEQADAESSDSETPKAPRYRTEERKLVVSNFKDENVCVLVQESLPGCEFELLSADQRFAEQTADEGVFIVEVPANGSRTISYTLKWRLA